MSIAATAASGLAQEKAKWPFELQTEHYPGTYCWSPGSAWDEESIDFNLDQFQRTGIRNIHLVPIYGARGAEDRYISFLSPRWMEMLGYWIEQAAARDMNIDMTTGTGWCAGGPGLPENAIDTRASYDRKTGTLLLKPGRKVKRAAPGGEGYMVDAFSPDAMRTLLERFSNAFDDSQARPRAQYHDSFEYAGNWSPGFADAFQQRRGYDIRDHLPQLFGKTSDTDKQARIKYDYRLTLAELHRETMAAWASWARDRGMQTRNQAHGAPANLLDVYAEASIPETEMFGAPKYEVKGFRRDVRYIRQGDSDLRVCMMASSAAHVAHPPGKQLVSSESCTWMREHWHGSLAQIKLEMDSFFLAGVNHVFYHGSCYSPKDAPWPGWFFYASTKMDWRNSIWRDARALNDYIARCQSVLQAGQPANDVLVYWPLHDLWSSSVGLNRNLTVHHPDWMSAQPIGHTADELRRLGFTFDFISDRMLESLRVDGQTIRAPGGDYRVILVPTLTHMPVATAEKLLELATAGARVVFEGELPADVPGFDDLTSRRASLHKRGRQLARLAGVGLPLGQLPVQREVFPEHGLQFVRRKTPDGYWYFVANHTAQAVSTRMSLAVRFKEVAFWDPMTGSGGRLRVDDGAFPLRLESGQTCLLQVAGKPLHLPSFTLPEPQGAPSVLSGPWRVEFIDGGPELPPPLSTNRLGSWTECEDKRAEAFAGTARYTLDFEHSGEAADWLLDLGDVRESARVRLNGVDLGVCFALPFRLRLGPALQQGANKLEVEVTNLSANRIRALDRAGGDWRLMRDANIVNVHYKPFEPSKWPVTKSGLLGPVTLTPMAERAP